MAKLTAAQERVLARLNTPHDRMPGWMHPRTKEDLVRQGLAVMDEGTSVHLGGVVEFWRITPLGRQALAEAKEAS